MFLKVYSPLELVGSRYIYKPPVGGHSVGYTYVDPHFCQNPQGEGRNEGHSEYILLSEVYYIMIFNELLDGCAGLETRPKYNEVIPVGLGTYFFLLFAFDILFPTALSYNDKSYD